MPAASDPLRRPRLVGGRVDAADSFPAASSDYTDRTPSERIEALRALSRRLYDTADTAKQHHDDGRSGHPRLPDRLVGGRR